MTAAKIGVAVGAIIAATSSAGAEDGKLRILTLNIWNKFKQTPQVTSDFMIGGNWDVLTFQEANGSRYVSDIPGILENAGLGKYGGILTGDVGVISRLPGSFGSYTSPGLNTQGRYVSYTIANEDSGRPQTLIGTVHLDYSDPATKRMAEAKALNNWARGASLPVILTGDFNAGDVSERGLHSVSQQELLLRIYTKNPTNSFYYDLLRQYATDDAALDKFISDWKGKGGAAIDAAAIPTGLFNDEMYPIAGNTPQTMNILKKQFMLLQTDAEREGFKPHELNDGSGTWPSAGEDDENVWGSWHRVKIDHFLASRPFGKWYKIDDDPNDPYAGVIKDVYVTKPDGTTAPVSDHEPVAHTFKWVGPALATYMDGTVGKTRLIWGAVAPVFEENSKEFYLSRNNMRNDVYLGQISDDNGNPILTGLTDQEKKTLLDCKSTDARFQQAIEEYCIDDHSFIGETVVTDGGTVIVDEDAALGGPDAALRLVNGGLRVAGTAMHSLNREVELQGLGWIDIADASNIVSADQQISGAGALSKRGDGTLVLSAANSYTGGTIVENGVLKAGVAGAFVNNTAYAVNGGTLDLNGFDLTMSLLTGAGTVKTGGAALGIGTLTPDGDDIGTLTVDGDLTLGAGSTYIANIAPDGTGDKLAVTGKATLEGGDVYISKLAGNYMPGQRYTILTADGGVAGAFGNLSQNMPFVDLGLTYDPRNVYLDIARNDVAFPTIGITRNQKATAGAIEALGAGNEVYDAVVLQDSEAAARGAFDQLSGEIHASATTALINDSRLIRSAVNDRLRTAFNDVAATDLPVLGYGPDAKPLVKGETPQMAAWGQAFGAWSKTDGNGNAADLDQSTGGFVTGFDTAVATDWRLGAFAGYSRTSFDARGSGESDNYHVGVYGGGHFGALSLRSGLGYSWHSVETSRSVAFSGFEDRLKADYDAGTFQAFGELGYRIDMKQVAFEPFANLAHVRVKTDGFTETGGAAALSAAEETTSTTFTTLGLRASAPFTLGTVEAEARGTVGWQHAYGDTTPVSTLAFDGGNGFSVAGVPLAEDMGLVEAGFDVKLSERTTLGVSYTGQFGSDVKQNGVDARFAVKF
ncbi:hypothetical protein GCM10011491_00850 [Brucella endophytica]|uniref:Autotransporter domain-containing protein n=2 Tax=Brucella endophytica TaxID=1963359 RepID=A0A916RYV6_9HYPH|nr:autotransporter domain-containing protein [Brucella endophytica]GGA77531.1 hypothetical protein GCM10011491_00850 [Brucella endophytica]